MENKLQILVKESGLEQPKAQVLLDNFSDYFKIAAEWEEKAKAIKVTDESQTADMKIARIGRLELAKKRQDIEKTRKELKEQSLREGKAIDGIANVLKALFIPIEQYLDRQEKFVEIKKAEKAELVRIEVEKKMKEDEMEEERLDNLAIDRRSKAREYRQFWRVENPDFRDMTEEMFQKCMDALKGRKIEHDAKQRLILEENAKLKKEADAREENIKIECKKQEKIAEKNRKESDARLAEEKAKSAAKEEKLKKEAKALKLRNEQEQRKREFVDDTKKRAEAKEKRDRDAEYEKERLRLEEKFKNQIECPKCKHKFQIKR